MPESFRSSAKSFWTTAPIVSTNKLTELEHIGISIRSGLVGC